MLAFPFPLAVTAASDVQQAQACRSSFLCVLFVDCSGLGTWNVARMPSAQWSRQLPRPVTSRNFFFQNRACSELRIQIGLCNRAAPFLDCIVCGENGRLRPGAASMDLTYKGTSEGGPRRPATQSTAKRSGEYCRCPILREFIPHR